MAAVVGAEREAGPSNGVPGSPLIERKAREWRGAATVALALFGYVSFGLRVGGGPGGAPAVVAGAVAYISVALWLGRLGETLFPERVLWRQGAGTGLMVGLLLLVPGGALWFALRSTLGLRDLVRSGWPRRVGRRRRDRRSEVWDQRFGSVSRRWFEAAVWAVWAISCLGMQAVVPWLVVDGLPAYPAFGTAAVVNALAMLWLMWRSLTSWVVCG